MKLRALGLRPGEDPGADVIEIDDSFQTIYDWIGNGCDCIDIARRYIGGRLFQFIVDDEGLLKDGNPVAVMGATPDEGVLVGNVLVVGEEYTAEGPTWRSLTDEEVAVLKGRLDFGVVTSLLTGETEGPHTVLLGMRYGGEEE